MILRATAMPGPLADAAVRERDPALDVFRGLAMTLVVLGHVTGLPELLHKYIYSFHMPAFFLLSGYLFNAAAAAQRPGTTLQARFFRLVVPAWVLGLLCGLPFLLFLVLGRRGITPDVFVDKLWGTLTGAANVTHTFLCTPLWFLFALFVVEAFAIVAAVGFRRAAPFAMLAVGACGVALGSQPSLLPFAIPAAMTACLFFAVGMLARRARLALARVPSWLPAVALLAWMILVDMTPVPMDMAANSVGAGPWLVGNGIAALAGAYLLLLVAQAIAGVDARLRGFFRAVGVSTLPIVGLNYWVNSLAVQAFGHFRMPHWALLFLVEFAVLLAIARGMRSAGLLGRLASGSWMPVSR